MSIKKILLVEDEPANSAILAAYLLAAGYNVDEVADGLEAWLKLEENPSEYSLVVTDKRMPKMNGIELASRIKADGRFSGIPVIMQTGDTAQDEFLRGIKAGVYYYLAKPYDEATLLALVRAALVERERKDVFERRLSSQQSALSGFMRGEFAIRTPEDAQNTAFLLGSLFPRPELAVTGLYEILLNAIEHGNLGIGYALKGALLSEGQWDDEINRRLAADANRDKFVSVKLEKFENRLEVMVVDQGQGFDWRSYMDIEPSRATHSNGRGIAKANLLSFDRLEFIGIGNQVRIISFTD